MSDWFVNFISGIVGGIVASGVFMWWLRSVRPKLYIEPKIMRRLSKSGKPIYRFRVENRGKRAVANVRAELALVTPRYEGGNVIQGAKTIPLVRSVYQVIPRFDKRDLLTNHIIRFATTYDLDANWRDSLQYLRFRVLATDSLSGTPIQFERLFRSRNESIESATPSESVSAGTGRAIVRHVVGRATGVDSR